MIAAGLSEGLNRSSHLLRIFTELLLLYIIYIFSIRNFYILFKDKAANEFKTVPYDGFNCCRIWYCSGSSWPSYRSHTSISTKYDRWKHDCNGRQHDRWQHDRRQLD